LTSFGGKLEQIFNKFDGSRNWKIQKNVQPFYDLFDHSKIVYLTPESPNTLEDLQEDHIYIIGAIADHNRMPGLSYGQAISRQLATAKLPISKHVKDFPNLSLNINHVFEILAKFAETKDWSTSILSSIPTRKGYQKQQHHPTNINNKGKQPEDKQEGNK